MRLINLDALNKYPIRRHRCDKKNANPHFINGIESVLEYANELPVVEERKHGHWVRHNNIIACSECIWDMYWEEGNTELNYCPYCGAIMDGEEE